MTLRLRERRLELEPGRPLLMGIVNATPDSFSDEQRPKGADELEAAADEVLRHAAIVDVGGESGRTDTQAVSEAEEAARIVPLVERLAARGALVSVDTWRAGPARAALDAGAAMINDVSGLSDPALADLCAETGAALVITHTRVPPKTKAFPDYEDVVADVVGLLAERCAEARSRGLRRDQLLLDPGLDLGKTTDETVEVLRRLPELEGLGRPLLLGISRKDFVGAITGRMPGERDPGTLAAIEPALGLGVGALLRVHDVAGAHDYLEVRAALRGERPAGALAEELRREEAA